MICKYDCKGCSLLNVKYKKQLDDKKKGISKAIKFEDVGLFFGSEHFYRNRLELGYNKGLAQRGNKGFIRINECIIANKKINELIKEINGFTFDEVNEVVIRTTSKESAIIFLVNTGIEEIKRFITSAENVLVNYGEIENNEGFAVKGSDILHEGFLGKEFCFSAFGFFQNNTEVAEKMLKYVHEMLGDYDTKNAQLLDLYGGVGTFGITNADLFKEVIVVESYRLSADMAQINIANNKIKNASVSCLSAKSIGWMKFSDELFVITDPPRSGMEEKTIDVLKKLKPEVIIYVSCNIEQLEKDVKKFKEYYIKSAALFDMFPQTRHCEAVVELRLQ